MNYVVVGTSNKSEIFTGYYTLYGDGATDMRPLGDFYKTEVWELAERIGVPQKIIDRPPTVALSRISIIKIRNAYKLIGTLYVGSKTIIKV